MKTRREFGKVLLAGLPASLALAARIDSRVNGVRIGTITYSFRDFPRTPGTDNVDAVIQALTECGIGEIELFSPNVEPASALSAGPGRPGAASQNRGSGPPNPQEQTAAFRARMRTPEAMKAREELRQWRLATPMEHFRAVRKKFDDAGIHLYAYTMNYRQDFTDEEVEKTFEQAKGLGVNIIASSTQLSMARRLISFAEKHKIFVAFHGHANTADPDEFSSPETFQKALDMSKYFKVNLDIGHFTAAGFDAVSYIQEHHDRITHLHVKDRKRNNGPNQPWGEGDTPIRQVLLLLKEKKYPIPAFIEYEYRGTGTSVEEVKKCLAYMKNILA